MLQRLLSPAPIESAGEGTPVAELEAPNTDVLEAPPTGDETPASVVPATEPIAPTSGLSKDDVQEILAGALKAVGDRQPATAAAAKPEVQMSQADFDKAFNVFKASPELLTLLRHENPAEAMKALEQFRDGMIRQAMTMAEYRMQQFVKELRDNDLAPLQSYVTEQQATSFRDGFFKENPELEKYENLVEAVATKLSGTIQPGTKSRSELFKLYADETKKIVTELTGAGVAANGDAANGNGKPPAPAAGKHKMSTLSGGGQQGSGKPTAASAKGPVGIEVFD